ncbi:MAG: beta-galactosidase trimerization domain-containing protein [Verrucomicrobiales bacterium]|nr:beta-galactosidase trimerization domain-containing protein [Verrucomicrobiales bacterium]
MIRISIPPHKIIGLLCFLCPPTLPAAEPPTQAKDAYVDYLRNSEDFRRVNQDHAWIQKSWPSWTYMPWYYQWTIGYDANAGEFCKQTGYNGALINHGDTAQLDWIEANHLRFYMDHTAGKGSLYLRKKSPADKQRLKKALPSNGVRPVPLNSDTLQQLKQQIRHNIEQVQHSPMRAAYALDDEISTGSFVRPCMWRLIEDHTPYQTWLKEIYGAENAPDYDGSWITYNDLRKNLATWSLGEFDCAQLMDQWTYNDAYWANYLGQLVEYSNSIDPATPCGFVGGQSPNAMGGYDYARLMRKIQFIEAYNIGSSQAIIRSFNPHNALPTVTTHFHRSINDSIWQAWYYLAQGNRGQIGWVENWFDGKKPKAWHQALAPHYREIAEKISPLQAGSEWVHDGIAIYYSHPSIQMSWILDAEAHGSTWANRNGDHRLGTSHLVRKAWENMLRDSGLQFNHVNYIDLVQDDHALDDFKVLILPATYCLSDAEAHRIREFAKRGGTVIADFLPGVFDQHGRGRPQGGALDDLFAVQQSPSLKAKDVFSQRLWVESDQDANFSYSSYRDLLSKHNDNLRHPFGFAKAVRDLPTNQQNEFGEGRGILMNLSPQWYHVLRSQGKQAASTRSLFIQHLSKQGIQPKVKLHSADGTLFYHEITYWKKGGRTMLFLIMNPEITGSSVGGGNSQNLKSHSIRITLEFHQTVKQVCNERRDKMLGDGKQFTLDWNTNEAIVLSFSE